MPQYERTQELPASADEAFAWHARPGAFARLAPPWQPLRLLEAANSIDEGERLVLQLRRGPLRLRWVAEHGPVEPGRSFEDRQLAGPFRSWCHRHLFEPITDSRSLLRDRIEYEIPGGKLGELIAGGSIRKDIERTFAYRHRTTVDDLTQHARFRDRPRLSVAISGAGGLVGSALCALLSTGGHRVVRLVRTSEPQLGCARWNPEEGLIDPEALEGVDAVVHLAGENIANRRWSRRRKDLLYSSRVDATRRLVASLGRLEEPPRLFVGASAIGFYGDRGNTGLDETSRSGSGFLAGLCRDWEQVTVDAGRFAERTVMARFGVILSPAGGALAKMLPAFRLGAGGPLGSGRQMMSWISLDDAIGAILYLLMTPSLAGPVNLTAPEPVSQRQFARTLGRVLRRPAWAPLPRPATRLAFGEMADEMLLASARVLPQRLLGGGYWFRHRELEPALAHLLGAETGPDAEPE